MAILGFDVVFAEPDDSSGLKSLDALSRRDLKDDAGFQSALKALRGTLDYDRRFAESMKGARSFSVITSPTSPVPWSVASSRNRSCRPAPSRGRNLALTTWNGYGANLPDYQANAASGGHFVPLVDFDGISRRVPMLVEYDGAYYESLSLAMVRLLLGMPPVVPGYADDGAGGRGYAGLEWLDLNTQRGTVRIPVDESAASLIPYRGKGRELPLSRLPMR